MGEFSQLRLPLPQLDSSLCWDETEPVSIWPVYVTPYRGLVCPNWIKMEREKAIWVENLTWWSVEKFQRHTASAMTSSMCSHPNRCFPYQSMSKTNPSFIKLHLVRCLVRTMKRSHLEKVTFLVRLQCVSCHKMTFKLFQKLWSCWKIAFCHIGLLILVGYGIPRLTLLPLQLESYFQPFNDVNLIEESFPYTDP